MKKIILIIITYMLYSSPAFAVDGSGLLVKPGKTYGLKAEYPVVVDKSRFIFSRYDKTGNTKEVVAVDPLTGTETILAGGRDVRYLADTDTYVAYYESSAGIMGRVKLRQKKGGRIFQSIKLSQGARNAYFAGDKLMVMQRGYSRGYPKPASHWSVFEIPSLKFLREFDAPAVKWMYHLNQETVLLAKRQIGLYLKGFNEKYAASFVQKAVRNAYCDPDSLVVTGQTAIFVANCGKLYSFSLTSGEFTSRHRLDQTFYSLASDGKFLFAIPKKPVNLPGHRGGVVIDLSNWNIIGKFDATGSATFAADGKLAVMSFPKWNKGLVSIYTYTPRNQ